MYRLLSAGCAVVLLAGFAGAEEPQLPTPTPSSVPTGSPVQPPASARALPAPVDYAIPMGDPVYEGPAVWGRVEALLWWVQGTRTPPLVADVGPPPSVLFGNSRLNDDMRGGLRTELGVWLFDGALALQGSYFFLAPGQTLAQFGSTATQTIVRPALQTTGRPFIDSNTGLPVLQQVTVPGALNGSVTVSSATTGVMGADLLLRAPLCCLTSCGSGFRLDALAGYRLFGLNDQLTIRENLTPIAAPFVPGTQIGLVDSFRTENTFHGGTLGLALAGWSGPCTLELMARVDPGAMNHEVIIFGSTQTTVPGFPPVTRPGGLLALPSNIGTYHSTNFALIPEFDARIGCRITERVSVTAGYSFLLLTNVVRAGDQIDLVVNPNQLPGAPNPGVGPARPAFEMRHTNTWIQGITLGVRVSW
jgi:hypothetical protein